MITIVRDIAIGSFEQMCFERGKRWSTVGYRSVGVDVCVYLCNLFSMYIRQLLLFLGSLLALSNPIRRCLLFVGALVHLKLCVWELGEQEVAPGHTHTHTPLLECEICHVKCD